MKLMATASHRILGNLRRVSRSENLPAMEFSLCSEVGVVREHNEDRVADFPVGLNGWGHAFMVADGMGGEAAGEVASHLAVDGLASRLGDLPDPSTLPPGQVGARVSRWIIQAVRETNREILEEAAEHPERGGMGSTIALTLFHRDWVMAMHVGDSRVFRLRGEQLELLTLDHSWGQEEMLRGQKAEAEIRAAPHRNHLVRVMGRGTAVTPTIGWSLYKPGDLILLCSDGLTNVLSPGEIVECLEASGDTAEAARRLIEFSYAGEAPDNVSVIVVDVLKPARRKLSPGVPPGTGGEDDLFHLSGPIPFGGRRSKGGGLEMLKSSRSRGRLVALYGSLIMAVAILGVAAGSVWGGRGTLGPGPSGGSPTADLDTAPGSDEAAVTLTARNASVEEGGESSPVDGPAAEGTPGARSDDTAGPLTPPPWTEGLTTLCSNLRREFDLQPLTAGSAALGALRDGPLMDGSALREDHRNALRWILDCMERQS